MGRTAPLTSKLCILYIYSTNIGAKYFKHALYSPFLSLQNAVCFIMLTCLVPVLVTFYIQAVLKLKKIIPAPKGCEEGAGGGGFCFKKSAKRFDIWPLRERGAARHGPCRYVWATP